MINQLLNLMIPAAHAAETPVTSTAQSGSLSFILMFVVFFVFIYFTVWRPQNRRAKEQQTLLNSLGKGDEALTIGGIYGRITKIQDRYVTLEIADGVNIVVQKTSIANVLPKGTLKSIE